MKPAGKARPTEATVALVLGILSPLACGVVLGPLAIWFGWRARQRIRGSSGQLGGEGLAIAGIWLGAIGAVVSAIIILRWLTA